MSTLKSSTRLGIAPPKATSPNLVAWWPFFDLSGTTIADKSGNSLSLTEIAGTVSAINSVAPGRGRWITDLAYLGVADTSDVELVDLTKSFIVTARVKIDAASDGGSGTVVSKGDIGNTLGFDLLLAAGGVDGKYLFRVGNGSSLTSVESTTVGVFDGVKRHVALVLDPINDIFRLYLDAINVSHAVVSVPAALTPSPNDHFMVGGKGHSGALSSGLHGITDSGAGDGNVDVEDVQPYSVTGALPSNYEDLISWLYRHPYQKLPTELW